MISLLLVCQVRPRRLPPSPSCLHRLLFTNADQIKRNDPYAQLGLTWGATSKEIKEAYRQKAREYHPDVAGGSIRKFQAIQEAYQKLMKHQQLEGDDVLEEWSFAVWRRGDVIAQERTDVAGQLKKRPAKPAASVNGAWGIAALGHPDGGGIKLKRGEYLGDGGKPKISSSVGTGQSKWVKPKEFKPWKPEDGESKRASLSKPMTTTTKNQT